MPSDAPGAIGAAVEALWAGGIVGLPTETVYGLCVLPQDAALAAVISAKRRSEEKGIALMVDSMAQVEALAVLPDAARRLAEHFWPGPLTLVLSPLVGVALPDLLYGATGSLGFRMPDHPTPRALAARLGPVAVTSANISGQPEARSAAELIASVGHSLALVLDGGPARGGVPSTVVEFDTAGQPRILRAGAIDAASIQQVARDTKGSAG
ncbi:MAG: L-threonylcarbamoyladenylate synthase [Candidatus Limnocylindrales bacterium]|nr:threonylcarbamoyl-AMP synthase [Chloroflexota bacterium]